MDETQTYRTGRYSVRPASYQIHDGLGNPTGWIPKIQYWWDEGAATVPNGLALREPVSTQGEANKLALDAFRRKYEEER